MNKKVIKAFSVGVAGLTTLSGMPVSAMETEITTEVSSEILETQGILDPQSTTETGSDEKESETEKETTRSTSVGSDRKKKGESEKVTEIVTESNSETESEGETEVSPVKEVIRVSNNELDNVVTPNETNPSNIKKAQEVNDTETGSTESESNDSVDIADSSIYSILDIVHTTDKNSNVLIKNGICYYTKMFVSIASVTSEDGLEISKISLVSGNHKIDKDYAENEGGVLVFEVPDGISDFHFDVEVVDKNSGYTKTLTINPKSKIDILSNVSEFKYVDSVNVSVDEIIPTLRMYEGNYCIEDYTVDNNEVQKGLKLLIKEDETGIDSIKLTANAGKDELELNLESSSEYVVGGMKDGVVYSDFELTVTTSLGLEKKFKVFEGKSFKRVSGNTTDVKGVSLTGDINTVGEDASYTNDEVTIQLEYNSEYTNISLYRDNVFCGSNQEYFVLNTSGTYIVRAENIFGDIKIYHLSDLFDGINNMLVIDKEVNLVDIEVNGQSLKDTFYKDTAKVNISLDDDTGVKDFKLYLNEREIYSEEMNWLKAHVSFDFNLEEESATIQGANSLRVMAHDLAGNPINWNSSIKFDNQNPEVQATLSKDYVVEGGMVFTGSDDKYLELTFNVSDAGSGIGNVEIYKDSALLEEGVKLTNGTCSFKVTESGEYSIKVTDNLDHVTEKKFAEFIDGNVSNYIVVDTEKPKISRVTGFDPNTVVNETNWYIKTNDLVYNVKDTNVKGVTCTVNGKEVELTQEKGSDTTTNLEDTYKVEKSVFDKLQDGQVEVRFLVVDKSGNTSEDVFNFSLDRENPTGVEATINGDYVNIAGTLYFKSAPSVIVKAKDTMSGIDKYKLNGEFKDTGTFILSEDTDFNVTVTDKAGNESSAYPLFDLLGINATSIKIDGEAPEINRVSGFDGDLNVNGVQWYSSKPVLTYSVSDRFVRSVLIVVNGKEYPQRVGSNTFNVPLTDVGDGEVSVEIKVEDNSGNVSLDKFTFQLDTESPTQIKGVLSKDYINVDGTLYFKEVPILDISASDIGVGVSEYYLNGEKNTSGRFTLGSGSYRIRVVDKLGNASGILTLSDVLGVDADRVVVDLANPTVQEVSSIKEEYVDDKGNKWFSKKPELIYSVKDDNLRNVEIKVNGEDVNVVSNDNGEYAVPTNRYNEGKNVVSLLAKDYAGNETSTSYAFYYDSSAPEEVNAKVMGSYNEYAHGIYFKEVPSIQVAGEDEGVGVGRYFFNTQSNRSGEFQIPEGNNTVSVSDILGNQTRFIPLSDLLGWKSNNVVIDGKAPRISKVSGFNEDLSYDDKLWFSKKPNLVYSVNDDYLKEVTITVNGESSKVSNPQSGNFNVDLSNVNDGRVVVDISAEDYAGNTSRESYTLYLDRKEPHSIKASVNRSFFARDTGIFFKSSPDLSLSAEDDGVGVNLFYLNNNSNTSGRFSLSDGEYSVMVGDRLGNRTSAINLGKLLNWGKERVVIDGVSPKIECSKPAGGVNNWYSKDQSYVANITDNVAIQSAKITINGRDLDTFTSSGEDVKATTLRASTSGVSPKSDGSYDVVVTVMDKAGNETEWRDSIYIDKEAPKVTKFVFNGTLTNNGRTINGGNSYSFFFNGSGTLNILVDDGEVSSGVKEVVVEFNALYGTSTSRVVPVRAGSASVAVPSNFRGYVTAYAVDNVGNKGNTERPDGLVSETSNWHANSVTTEIVLPKENGQDTSGLPLYNKRINASINVGCKASGISRVEWGVGDTTLGTALVSASGAVSGAVTVRSSDNNLILAVSGTIPVSDNSNNLELWVKVIDRLGNISEDSKRISIDTDIPRVSVSYDKVTAQGEYYNEGRIATIRVSERNFTADGVKFSGEQGVITGWSKEGDAWVTRMPMLSDGEYDWSLVITDRAGNSSIVYNSPKFTVDSESPKVSVSFDDETPVNGMYFSKGRVATISVVDDTFDEKLFELSGDGKLGAWVHRGNVHSSKVIFNEDGEYRFSVKCRDKAGNTSNIVNVSKFIIDTEAPKLEITGVEKGVSYKKNIKFTVKVSDKYLSKDRVRVALIGRSNGAVYIPSKFDEASGEFTFDGFGEDKKFDDVYTLRISATDEAMNKVTEEIPFTLNRYGSTYSLDEEVSNMGNYFREPKDITLHELNIDKLDLKKCKVVVIKDGKTLDVADDLIAIEEEKTDEGWKYSYKIDKKVFSSNGKYQIQVYSVSKDGTDYSNVSQEYSFILDDEEPDVVLSGIESGESYREYSKHVTVDVRDLSGVKDLEVLVNGEEVTWYEENGLYAFDILEGKENQEVLVRVIDNCGNVTESKVSDFFITSSIFAYVVNQPWFKAAAIGSAAVLSVLLGLILRSQLIARRVEVAALKKHKDMYDKSRSSSSESDSDK